MYLSIVTTLYFSSPYIHEFYDRICREIDKITNHYEIIFVNDGSPDDSLDVARQLCHQDSRVSIVDLSRNFGHHKAMMTGLAHTTGELVFLIDVDLEEPPELLSQFYDIYQHNTVDVVYGVQAKRQGSILSQLLGGLYYKLFNFLSDFSIELNPLTARLMSQRYVQQLIRHQEHLFSIEGLWEATGFQQIAVPTYKAEFKGTTTYNLGRKIAYVMNAITAFSNKPLLYIAYLGLLMVFVALCSVIYLLIGYYFFGLGITGWTSLIISVWFLGGLIILILGIIAIYVSVIFVEIKQRPYTIVREVYNNKTIATSETENSVRNEIR
jgi:putative glycosyltransferase